MLSEPKLREIEEPKMTITEIQKMQDDELMKTVDEFDYFCITILHNKLCRLFEFLYKMVTFLIIISEFYILLIFLNYYPNMLS
jgi:hypothetical protein